MKSILLTTSALVVAWGGACGAADRTVQSVQFSPTPAPSTVAEMAVPYSRSIATITYSDGSRRYFPLRYDVLTRSGDRIGGKSVGLVVDRHGQPVTQATTDDGNVVKGPFHAYGPDANSLIQTKSGPRLITHYEYHTEETDQAGKPANMYRQLPMLMTMTSLDQNDKTGQLTARAVTNVDFSGTQGLWVPCAGTLTPWNTHLGGEEYEPDARLYQSKPLEAMNLYLGTPGKTADQGGAKPYRYGHLMEVAIHNDRPVATKHYATGRLSNELADVQEDGRTLIFGDDGRDVVLFMFVADRVADLSAGTLYAARFDQVDGTQGGRGDLRWIRLGHATDAQIKSLVDGGIHFSDIFQTASQPTPGFRAVHIYLGAQPKEKSDLEYLKLKPGMEQAAAFLESRRYAAYVGATSEFTKMEGQTHDPQGRKLYTAMSYVEQGMVDGKNAARPQDHIRLTGDDKVLGCGIVYESTLSGGQYDTDGQYIASDWVPSQMSALIMGAKPGQDSNPNDKCATNRVANPDNLKFSPAMRTLFIGEDSGNHVNNFLWAYNVDNRSLTRIFSGPAGGENTGLAVVESLNGHAYILANVQHPGAAEDLGKYSDEIKQTLRKSIDRRGMVGTISGLPALK